MAITALDAVSRAMRKIRVLGVGRQPTSAETTTGLAELNDMFAEWSIDGIDLAPTTLESTDEIDAPDDHNTAIILGLAARLSGIYGGQLSPVDAASLDRRFAILRAYHFSIKTIGIDHPAAEPRAWWCD